MKKSIISTEKISKILAKHQYKANPIIAQIFGEIVWTPTTSLSLSSTKSFIRLSELVPIKTENELLKLIKSKLS